MRHPGALLLETTCATPDVTRGSTSGRGWNVSMEVNEITILSPTFLGGQTFGPVTLEPAWEGPVDLKDELPVIITPRGRRCMGIHWYPEMACTRGVFTVTGDRIIFRPTAPVVIERTTWWRRCGYRLLTFWSPRQPGTRESSPTDRRRRPDPRE